jgi:hypothetical protein
MAANFAYALVQVLHNAGAAAVVGGPAAAWLWTREKRQVPAGLAWLTLLAWVAQALSGIGFALTSFYTRGELPEIVGIALTALSLKLVCALMGAALAGYYLTKSQPWRDRTQQTIWRNLFFVGGTALCAAAFLRWYG